MTAGRVLGIDACKAGWIGVALGAGAPSAYFAPRIADLIGSAADDGDVAVVAVDMPIGLPDAGRRQADVLAKSLIGPRRSSVFLTPVRAALQAADHPTGVAINRELAGEGMSIQAFGLRTKLFEVEAFVRRTAHRVVEVHPEVSFATLNGAPLVHRKTTWAGAAVRLELLRSAGIVIEGALGTAGRFAAVDDMLDAGAAAWTARRVADRQARTLPDPPEVFSDGLPSSIWA